MFKDMKVLERKDVIKLCDDNGIPWPDSGVARIYLIKLASAAYELGVQQTVSDECKLRQEVNQW